MNKILLTFLASASLLCLTNCETFDEDDNHRHSPPTTTTTTTEETTLRSPTSIVPVSTTVETQTTRNY